jgi:hypothetical protein
MVLPSIAMYHCVYGMPVDVYTYQQPTNQPNSHTDQQSSQSNQTRMIFDRQGRYVGKATQYNNKTQIFNVKGNYVGQID